MSLLLSLLLLAVPASAADPAREIAEQGTPPQLGPIGAVTGGRGVAYATGFLVSECEVLTVRHAAGRVRSAIGRRMRFTQAGPEGRQSGGTVVAEGDYEALATPASDRAGDWLLLRLDDCLGREAGHVTLSRVPIHQSGHWAPGSPPIQSAGFPIGRDWREGITRDPACRVRAAQRGVLLNDCAARPGNSGSPLFEAMQDGSMTVYGMQAAGAPALVGLDPRRGAGNVAIAVDAILPRIAPLLTPALTAGALRQAR